MAEHILSGNTTNLENLKSTIASKATEIEENIASIYENLSLIVSEGAWSGPAADTFMGKCNDSKKDLDNLVKFLNEYSELLGTVNKNLNTLCTTVSSTCKGVE